MDSYSKFIGKNAQFWKYSHIVVMTVVVLFAYATPLRSAPGAKAREARDARVREDMARLSAERARAEAESRAVATVLGLAEGRSLLDESRDLLHSLKSMRVLKGANAIMGLLGIGLRRDEADRASETMRLLLTHLRPLHEALTSELLYPSAASPMNLRADSDPAVGAIRSTIVKLITGDKDVSEDLRRSFDAIPLLGGDDEYERNLAAVRDRTRAALAAASVVDFLKADGLL